jgi:osmotically-inducible protein OsmY
VITSHDDELRRAVETGLRASTDVDASQVVVSVDDGLVTLSGRVPSYSHKWEAERAVERIPGIRGVANELEVHSDTARRDSDIARRAVQALRRNPFVPKGAVTVRVENGWVVLSGEAGRDVQRRGAERAVRNLPGVRGVTNLVTLRPKETSRGVSG